MKIAAVTMVYRDHWALSQWYAHFARHLGAENLFVVAHGADPALAGICPGASIVTVPRDRLDGFDAMRADLLNGLQAGLGAVYDWVIRTDCDELILLDPARHSGFADLFARTEAEALFALGLNIAEAPQDAPLADRGPALPQRRRAVFSGHYSKAWAVRRPLGLVRHGVALGRRRVETAPFVLPRGVYLAHLKFAHRAALEDANRHRRDIATGPGEGLPGSAWAKPVLAARKFYQSVEAMPERPWPEAELAAWSAITRDPLRDPGKGVLRARNIRFDWRTRLPAEIAGF